MSKYPGAMRQAPIDRNDREHESNAVYIPWKYTGIKSEAAHTALDYLDDTAWLFSYKGRLVITDESLELTDAGDGTTGNPFGGPRFEADTMGQIEGFLEWVAEDLED